MNEIEKIRKGFNAGYFLEKHKPELARLLQSSLTDSEDPYAQAFIKGSREYMQENFLKGQNSSEPDAAGLDLNVPDKERGLDEKNKDSGIEL